MKPSVPPMSAEHQSRPNKAPMGEMSPAKAISRLKTEHGNTGDLKDWGGGRK